MDLKALARELHADERAELLAHLLALGAEDRRLRFEYSMSDDGVRRYVEGIDFSHDAVFVVTDADLTIVGAAHLARKDRHAELGVSVLSQSRGRGIGAALLERSAARTRNWGIRVMFMNCLVENAAMMHLARKQGLKIAVSGAEAEAFVHLPRADLTSLAAEVAVEHLGLFDHARNRIGWRYRAASRNETIFWDREDCLELSSHGNSPCDSQFEKIAAMRISRAGLFFTHSSWEM